MASQQVEAALRALYHHPDAPVRRDANKWLQDFQRSMDAWQVSDTLLHHPDSNLETLIFSSQTLKAKVQRDFEELPPEAFVPLRESLKNLLKKFCKGPNKVRTQISIAMAALAVHVPLTQVLQHEAPLPQSRCNSPSLLRCSTCCDFQAPLLPCSFCNSCHVIL